jgi:predicted AlkP superfamily phosphohydrolase/phosphomutase
MIAKLEAAPGPDGTPLGTKVLKPQDVYPEVRGIAPDLIVYFGDLAWRSVGIGREPEHLYLRERHRARRGEPRSQRRVGDGRPPGAGNG